jgi:hypothetical protein
MTSSQKGEYSYAWNDGDSIAKKGGVFTNAWLQTINKLKTKSTAQVSWQAFLADTYSNVQKVIDHELVDEKLEQHPFFMLE